MRVITCVEDLRLLARRRVPRMFYNYVDSGSWSESAYRANQDLVFDGSAISSVCPPKSPG
jgi:hypothetical protein